MRFCCPHDIIWKYRLFLKHNPEGNTICYILLICFIKACIFNDNSSMKVMYWFIWSYIFIHKLGHHNFNCGLMWSKLMHSNWTRLSVGCSCFLASWLNIHTDRLHLSQQCLDFKYAPHMIHNFRCVTNMPKPTVLLAAEFWWAGQLAL